MLQPLLSQVKKPEESSMRRVGVLLVIGICGCVAYMNSQNAESSGIAVGLPEIPISGGLCKEFLMVTSAKVAQPSLAKNELMDVDELREICAAACKSQNTDPESPKCRCTNLKGLEKLGKREVCQLKGGLLEGGSGKIKNGKVDDECWIFCSESGRAKAEAEVASPKSSGNTEAENRSETKGLAKV